MRVRALSLLLAALPAAAGSRVSALHLDPPVPPVALYTSFQYPPSADVIAAMHAELDSILAPAGVQFQWRSLANNHGNEVSAQLAVLTFKGRCDVAGLTYRTANVGALGWTHITDGVILPFADIDCERVRLFLQHELLYYAVAERAPAFGRALARVVAHELYHIFARTTEHGEDGICKAAFSVHDLLAGQFQLEVRNLLEMRHVLVRVEPTETAAGAW